MTASILRLRRNTITIMVLLVVAGLAGAFVAFNGMDKLDLPVKAAIGVIVMLAVAVVTYFRPVTFPFGAFLFMVPFDNLLQTGGGTITKFLSLLSAGVVLFLLVNRRRRIAPPFVVGLWALFLIWNVASLMWSQDPWFGIDKLITTAQLFVLCVIFGMLRVSGQELKTLLVAAVAGGVACAGYGVWLFTHGTNIAVNSALSQRLSISLGNNSFINADHFAAALVFPVAIAMVAAIHLQGWRKVLSAGALICLLGGIYVSATRGSLIGVGVVFLYLMIYYRHRVQLAVIGALGLAASIPFPNMWLRFIDPSQGDAGGRYGIWGVAWDAFKQRWLGGIGTGQFRLAYEDSYLKAAPGINAHPWQEDPHNLIASTAVELGLIGLALILVAWFYQVRVAKCIPRSSPLFDWRIAVEAGVVGLFVDSLTVDMMFYKYLWIAFILGVVVRNAGLSEHPAAVAVNIPESGMYALARSGRGYA